MLQWCKVGQATSLAMRSDDLTTVPCILHAVVVTSSPRIVCPGFVGKLPLSGCVIGRSKRARLEASRDHAGWCSPDLRDFDALPPHIMAEGPDSGRSMVVKNDCCRSPETSRAVDIHSRHVCYECLPRTSNFNTYTGTYSNMPYRLFYSMLPVSHIVSFFCQTVVPPTGPYNI